MKRILRTTTAAICFVLLQSANACAGDPIQSGPKPGFLLRAFPALIVTGPYVGKKINVIQIFGRRPYVAIFARKIDMPMIGLLTKLDKVDPFVYQGKLSEMGGFLCILDQDPKFETKLKELHKNHKMKKFVLCTYGRLPQYKIAKEAEVTVLLCRQKRVRINHSFRRSELNRKAVDRIMVDVAKILKQ